MSCYAHREDPAHFVDIFNRTVEPVAGKCRLSTHLCFGNYKGRAVGLRRYAPMFPAFLDMQVDEMHVEMASREFAELEIISHIAEKIDVAVGIVDVKSYYIETVEDIAARVEACLGPRSSRQALLCARLRTEPNGALGSEAEAREHGRWGEGRAGEAVKGSPTRREAMSYKPVADQRPDRYKVSTAEYAQYQKQGFLVVERLVDLDEVEGLKAHVMAMLKGQIDVPGQEPPSPEATEEELVAALHAGASTAPLGRHLRTLSCCSRASWTFWRRSSGRMCWLCRPCSFSTRRARADRVGTKIPTILRRTRIPSSALGWPWSGPTRRTAVCGSRLGRTTSLFIQMKAGGT